MSTASSEPKHSLSKKASFLPNRNLLTPQMSIKTPPASLAPIPVCIDNIFRTFVWSAQCFHIVKRVDEISIYTWQPGVVISGRVAQDREVTNQLGYPWQRSAFHAHSKQQEQCLAWVPAYSSQVAEAGSHKKRGQQPLSYPSSNRRFESR